MEIVSFVSIVVACTAVGIALYALRNMPAPVQEVDLPHGTNDDCRKKAHLWGKHPNMISDDEAVYWCKRGCGSSLRHKVVKEG